VDEPLSAFGRRRLKGGGLPVCNRGTAPWSSSKLIRHQETSAGGAVSTWGKLPNREPGLFSKAGVGGMLTEGRQTPRKGRPFAAHPRGGRGKRETRKEG